MGKQELLAKVRQYRELQQFIKQLSDEADGIKSDLTALMDSEQTDSMTVDVFTIKYTSYHLNPRKT